MKQIWYDLETTGTRFWKNAIPHLKEELEAFEDGSIDRDMITPIMLNHVLEYTQNHPLIWYVSVYGGFFEIDSDHLGVSWNLKSAHLKDQSEELINFLNDLK